MSDPSHHFAMHKLSKKQTTKAVDSMAYVVGIGGNVAVLPQIVKAWQSDAPGLAVLTWVLFICFGFVWLAYAIIHKQKPLIVAQVVSIGCNIGVVLGWVFNNWLR